MKFKVVKLERFSGDGASVYTVLINGSSQTLFEEFLQENFSNYSKEINNILGRIKSIGHRTGAQEGFFKNYEGNFGDGICALYDQPNSHLRLYCIRYSNTAIVLGGGGLKSKKIKALQDDPKLTKENYLLREISKRITSALKDKDISWSHDGYSLIGNLTFQDHDDDD